MKTEVLQDEPPHGRLQGQVIDFPPRVIEPYRVPLDRSVPPERGVMLWVSAAALVATVLVGGALWWRQVSPKPSSTALDLPAATAQRPAEPLSIDTAVPPPLALAPAGEATAAPADVAMPQLPAPDLAPVLTTLPDDDPVVPGAPASASAGAPAAAHRASPTLVFDGGTGPGVGMVGSAPTPTVIEPTTGSARDISAMVTKGTLVPAILETPIDADKPGFVRAIVSIDVRSFDGKTLLIPRSSRLSGQYTVKTSSGQKRAYVNWTRLVRPDGKVSAVGVPGTTSGPLLSVVGSLAGGKESVRMRQGEPIRIFAARDLNLSSRR